MAEPAHAKCEDHPTEPVCRYCSDCKCGVCAICPVIKHRGHLLESLPLWASANMFALAPTINTNTSIHTQLLSLLNQVEPLEKALHNYVDDELHALEQVLEEKRAELHRDVNSRTDRMNDMLSREKRRCAEELNSLEHGQAVMTALSKGEGAVPGPAGGLIHGKISYDDFLRACDPELHDPQKMLHLLGLQLPMQNLQDMCELVTWTPLSLSTTPQIFP